MSEYYESYGKPFKRKPLRHKWNEQEGFRKDVCEHCGAIRYWDQGFQREMYMKKNGEGPFFWSPQCQRILVSTHK